MKIKKEIFYFAVAFLLGVMASARTLEYLGDIYTDKIMICSLKQVMETIFFSMNKECREYVDIKNVLLYRWMFLFYGLGLIMLGATYLKKSKKYNGFILNRCHNYKNAIKNIYGNNILNNICYVFMFFFGIVIGYALNSGQLYVNDGNYVYILMFAIIKVMQFQIINLIMFVVYLKYNVSCSVMSGFVCVTVLVCLDIMFPLSLIFFDSNYMFVDAFIINGIVFLVLNQMINRLKIDLEQG